ncbi:MAG TPA: N-acetylglucosamine-6-phosphate deacetylase [Mobilitalea sp.]|nr:N-acetylglucosamine-6-phosphate deacetylase [Mobilitalea sp.]
MIIKNANIYLDTGDFKTGGLIIEEDRIRQVGTTQKEETDCGAVPLKKEDDVIDASGLYAIPGLTDIHFHGCAGYDFCDGTKEAFDAITNYEAAHGVTTICPATMTLPEKTLANICRSIASYQNNQGSILSGIHMEGPFLSVKKKGAQNEAFLHKPDIELFRRLNKLCGNRFKIVSIAPEEDGAMDFISEICKTAVISLAHTTAGYDLAAEALKHGASHVTHLYNAMPSFHHRDPGIIGAAFDNPDCTVELICDGIHLHPSVIRATLKMFGEDRIIFVSDSMMATGLPDGTYSLGGQTVHVTGKKAVLGDGTIAGSVTNLMDCLKNAVINLGIPLETAVKASAVNPAKRIGIYDNYGSITPGKVANIVLLDQDLNVKMVLLKGKKLN